nr:TetR/AcrR family transcriptional regulator [uncultured Cohaesibacter sp.]
MTGIQKTKSIETGRRVLEAAVALMREDGLKAVQIRTIASKAGYSVGSVYKHFPDIDALIIAVNGVTLTQMNELFSQSMQQSDDPLERLKMLARSYMHFAYSQPNLWRGLFEHHLPDDDAIPDEHKAQNVELLALIERELANISPTLDQEALSIRSRTCFAAVHGMVTFSMEGRFVGLSGQQLEDELDFLVARLSVTDTHRAANNVK